MLNPFFVDMDEAREREMTPLLIGMVSLGIAVFGAREGRVIWRSDFDTLFEKVVQPTEWGEDELKDSILARITMLERIAPHQIPIRRRIGEDELLKFRAAHGFWKSGRAAAINSYRQGTILYFSNSQEAVLAKIVLDTSRSQRLSPEPV